MADRKPISPPVIGEPESPEEEMRERPRLCVEVNRRFRFELRAQADTREHLRMLLLQLADEVGRSSTEGFANAYAYDYKFELKETPDMEHADYFEKLREQGSPEAA